MKRLIVAWGVVVVCSLVQALSAAAGDCCKAVSGSQQLTLYSGSEQIIWVGFAPQQVVAANPAVVRGGVVFPVDSQRIFLKGRAPGRTKVMVWGRKGQKREIMVRVLARDLRMQLKQLCERLRGIRGVCCCIKGGRIVVHGQVELPQELAKVCTVAAGYPQVELRVGLKPGYLHRIAAKLAEALRPWAVRVLVDSSGRALVVEGELRTMAERHKVLWIARQYYPTIIDRLVIKAYGPVAIRIAGTMVP